MQLTDIDVCIVATRRPDLLARTLESFHEHLLRHFQVGLMIANIDPLFGTEEDEARCVELIRDLAPSAIVRTPREPCFTTAVAGNWLKSGSDVLLHLEDDWLLKRHVRPDHLQPFLDYPWLGQISFNHANKRWDIRRRGAYSYASRPRRLLGVKTPLRERRQNFLTGPSFLRGRFARQSAALMDPAFDPEKQFCRGHNPRLERYVADFRNLIVGEIDDYYIEDTGRQWRQERRIEKRIVEGQSYWSPSS